jgi:hypothetical protein
VQPGDKLEVTVTYLSEEKVVVQKAWALYWLCSIEKNIVFFCFSNKLSYK